MIEHFRYIQLVSDSKILSPYKNETLLKVQSIE